MPQQSRDHDYIILDFNKKTFVVLSFYFILIIVLNFKTLKYTKNNREQMSLTHLILGEWSTKNSSALSLCKAEINIT